MQRRHFLKLSATTSAALLFSRLTHAASNGASIINSPDEVWAQSGTDWVKLTATNGSHYTYKEIAVSLKTNGNALGVYASSPKQELSAVRLKWKHNTPTSAKFLGDH